MALPQLSLTINQFVKTPEGMAMIAEQKPFVLGGVIYQGFNGQAATCSEKTMTLAEIEAAPDVDGTKERVYRLRREREGGRHDRKSTEYRKRRAELRAQRNEILDAMEKSEKRGVPSSPADLEDIAEIDRRMERLSTIAFGFQGAAGGIKAPASDTEVALKAAGEQIQGFDPSSFGSPDEALQAAKKLLDGTTVLPPQPRVASTSPTASELSEMAVLREAGLDPEMFGGTDEALQVARALRDAGGVPPEPEPLSEVEPIPDVDAVIAEAKNAVKMPVKCDLCGKQSPPGRNDPSRWLHAHKMGAHNNPRKKD